jgi:hypothetical protein
MSLIETTIGSTVILSLPEYIAPPAPITRFISVGAFFDRFGALKWAILADTNPGVQALIKDCTVRKYIDLDNPALPFGLDMLIAAGHAVDKVAILTAPIAASEAA